MRKSSRRLPALGVGTAVLTIVTAYLILRFVPSYSVEITALAVAVLLVALAAFAYRATKQEQAATFVAIALVLPYLLIGAVAFAGLERASSEIESFFEDEFPSDEELFEDEGASESESGTYGSDPELDALQDDCLAGDAQACDDLFIRAPAGSEYETTAEENGGGF